LAIVGSRVVSLRYFEDALRAWWGSMWPELLAYQKRYVDGGFQDDGSFPGHTHLSKYEWLVVNRTIEEHKQLRALFIVGVRTNLGATSPSCTTQIAQEFLQQAFMRIAEGKLLFGDPNAIFDEIYPSVETFAKRTDSLQFEAVISLLNVRIDGTIALDDRTTIRQMTNAERSDISWKDAVWDDQWEMCAVVEHIFDDPILAPNAASATRDQEFVELGRDILLTLSTLSAARATLGKIVIRPHGWSPAQGASSRLIDYPFESDRLRIANTDAELLRESWIAIHHQRDRRVRIGGEYLADPRRLADPEKGLIDVVTAVEALVGEDARRRLVRRLSLYAARLVASGLGLSEREVYDDLMRAFSRRENALRGREPSPAEKDADGALVRSISAVARSLLVMRIRSDTRLKADPIDVMLRNPPPPRSAL
jgi:hypothetical protein